MPYYERENLSFQVCIKNMICPYCGNRLMPIEGCLTCVTGDWSACS